MNFLAHTYLSGSDHDMIVGNFIGDKVKGHHTDDYPSNIRRGLLLHREIDSFTDSHEIVCKTKSRFVSVASHYAGVVTDVVYDHYLAANWTKYSDISLSAYSVNIYVLLMSRWFSIPVSLRSFLWNFVSTRRITEYAKIDGVQDTFDRMHRSTSLPDISVEVRHVLEDNYEAIGKEFNQFFSEMITHCDEFKKNLYTSIK